MLCPSYSSCYNLHFKNNTLCYVNTTIMLYLDDDVSKHAYMVRLMFHKYSEFATVPRKNFETNTIKLGTNFAKRPQLGDSFKKYVCISVMDFKLDVW